MNSAKAVQRINVVCTLLHSCPIPVWASSPLRTRHASILRIYSALIIRHRKQRKIWRDSPDAITEGI
jgi:hypothetical protein